MVDRPAGWLFHGSPGWSFHTESSFFLSVQGSVKEVVESLAGTIIPASLDEASHFLLAVDQVAYMLTSIVVISLPAIVTLKSPPGADAKLSTQKGQGESR